ncbi:flagellar hook-length control protein FliK [Marinobacterium sediminicola]|nr:flagellar hook-length control protein FliK [Marinobacterium sediminicola]ULG68767.1 flagellar hook-length control protein FliK [Marinobacterium sediminicola]
MQADSGESSDLGQSSRQDNQNAAFSAAVQGRGQNHAQAVASPSGQTFAQQLQQQLAEPRWGRQVGDRAIMMAQHGPRTAYIQLDPPELGAMQIRVHLQGQDQVSISFTSANPVVREALEQQMPRLREMFADQGLNLQDSSVSDEARQQGSGQRDQADSFGRQGGYGGGEGSDAEPLPVPSVAVGLVDYYA